MYIITFTLSKLLVHIGAIEHRIALWKKCLPNVKPFYAVKCNNLHPLLYTLQKAGVGFDCASSDEFARVRGHEIIYANPCKARDELIKAGTENITFCTFDTAEELVKIKEVIPESRPILRIHVDDKGGSRIPLNRKFGLSLKDVDTVDKHKFYGLAFHVGSDCTSLDSYKSAFETVREFMGALKHKTKFIPHTLDIGGGFSGRSTRDEFFREELAPLINNELKTLPFYRVIAEPGRFFAEEACSLEVPIIGRKKLPCGTHSLTVDDSVYGIFSGVLFDGFKPEFHCLTKRGINKTNFTIFGRTCDSADRIAENVALPSECKEGDILRIPNIGAYSYVSASEFNGFPRPDVQVLL